MPDETYVTRRELDLLKAAADLDRTKLWAKLEALDEHGSRGVAALQIRMDNMVTSVAEMKAEMAAEFGEHRREHEKEEAKRTSARRWLVGSVIAAVAAVDGPVVTLFLARGR